MDRHLTLICGPPCAGKSTWAGQHSNPGDLIVDRDLIARGMGSPPGWMHRRGYRLRAEQAMRAKVAALALDDECRAWVIRSLPHGQARTTMATWLRATTVLVLLPDLPVLLARAASRPHPRRTEHAIRSWLARYTPADIDTVITT